MEDKMKSEWWRTLPHTHYGNWGGHSNTHKKWDDAEPIDKLDELFRAHDFELDAAKGDKKKRYQADKNLYIGASKIKLSDLRNPFYGAPYLVGVLIVFRRK